MGSCRRRKSSWSDLYPEIISSICQYLETRLDILSFRGVCKQWRKHCVPPPGPPPNLLSPLLPYRVPTSSDNLPPLQIFGSLYSDGQVDLFVKSIYLITPIVIDKIKIKASSSWMVMAAELEPRKIQLRHPLTGGQIENLPEALDLNRFKVSELAQGYELQYPYSSQSVRKVALCSSSASPTLGDSIAMVLGCSGELGALRLSESIQPRWSNSARLENIPLQTFDDFVSFKGMYVAVNRHGSLFSVEYDAENSSPLVVTDVLVEDHICNHVGRRKRLVVDPVSDKLYLVERVHVAGARFKVYQFNEEFNKWDKVEALSHHRALFVGVHHCFFAPARGFSGCPVNCIIFVTDSFPPYPGYGYSSDFCLFKNAKQSIGVYHLGKCRNNFSVISDYPELLQMMEPPPACFSTSEWESSEAGVMQSYSRKQGSPVQSDSSSRNARLLGNDEVEHEVQSESNREDDPPKSQEQINERPSTSAAQGDATRSPTVNGVVHVAEKEAPRVETVHSVTVGDTTSLTRGNKSNTSIVKFEGLDIRSDLVPTLEKIWSKHGNIIGNSNMHNGVMISKGIELLATVVVILESNSARSLTDSQADCLTSALSDFRDLHFKVDWLLPTVEKALALHKSKPLVESFNKLSQSKAKVAERISKFIDGLAKNYEYEKKLEKELARMSKIIPFAGEEDFDQPLGGGL